MPRTTTAARGEAPGADFIPLAEVFKVLHLDSRTGHRLLREGRLPPPDLRLTPHRQYWRRARFEAWLSSQAPEGEGAADAS